jgi:hypothetical protein
MESNTESLGVGLELFPESSSPNNQEDRMRESMEDIACPLDQILVSFYRIETAYRADDLVVVEGQSAPKCGDPGFRRLFIYRHPIGNHLHPMRGDPDPLRQEAPVVLGHGHEPSRKPANEPVRDASSDFISVVILSMDRCH